MLKTEVSTGTVFASRERGYRMPKPARFMSTGLFTYSRVAGRFVPSSREKPYKTSSWTGASHGYLVAFGSAYRTGQAEALAALDPEAVAAEGKLPEEAVEAGLVLAIVTTLAGITSAPWDDVVREATERRAARDLARLAEAEREEASRAAGAALVAALAEAGVAAHSDYYGTVSVRGDAVAALRELVARNG